MQICKYIDKECAMNFDCRICLTFNEYISWRNGSENGFVPKSETIIERQREINQAILDTIDPDEWCPDE